MNPLSTSTRTGSFQGQGIYGFFLIYSRSDMADGGEVVVIEAEEESELIKASCVEQMGERLSCYDVGAL